MSSKNLKKGFIKKTRFTYSVNKKIGHDLFWQVLTFLFQLVFK